MLLCVGLLILLVGTFLFFSKTHSQTLSVNTNTINLIPNSKPTEIFIPKPAVKVKPKYVLYSYIHRITGYTLAPGETDSTPFIAACGDLHPIFGKLKRGEVVFAVSQDLLFRYGKRYICGRKAYLEYRNGKRIYGVIYDTMNARYSKSIDVLVYQYGVSISVLREAVYKHYGAGKTGNLYIQPDNK